MELDDVVGAPRPAGHATQATQRDNRPRIEIVSVRALVLLVLAGAAALLVSGSTPARAGSRAARRSTHSLTATIQEVDISTGRVPFAGSTATAAATLQAMPGGNGAQVTHLSFTGPTGAPATFGFTGKATAFLAAGSLTLSLDGTLAVGPGGSLKFAGKGRITGGTARYRRAAGRLTFTGTAPSAGPGHVDTIHYKGTISY